LIKQLKKSYNFSNGWWIHTPIFPPLPKFLNTDEKYKDGFSVPTIFFADVTRDTICATEEMFGPLVTATRFHTEDEVVAIANESLSGSQA